MKGTSIRLKNQEQGRIVVVGGYGFDNLGDDLILRAALKSIRKLSPETEVVVLSNNPFETAERHRDEIVSYSPEALVRQMIFRVLSRISGSYRDSLLPIPGRTFRQISGSIGKTNLILSLGGGYLNDNSRSPYPQLRLAELAFFGLCGRRLVMCAQELGPFSRTSSILLAKLAVKSLTYATVRDSRSLKVLSNVGFPKERLAHTADESWSYDPVASLGLKVRRRKKSNGLTMAVNLMPLQTVPNVYLSDRHGEHEATELNAHLLFGIASCFELAKFKRTRFLHFLSMSSRDTAMAVRLRSILGDQLQIDIVSDLDSQYSALARSDIMIGMRMHSIIMAAQVGVPPMAIAVLPKVFDTMNDLGLSGYALSIDRFTARKLQRLLLQALRNSQIIRKAMMERVKVLRQKANQNMRPVRLSIRAPA
jgi:polysaccharide pyruvyl transferase WcaK-like protein